MALFVFSCQENICDVCLNEMQTTGLSIKLYKWLKRGTGIMSSDASFSEVSQAFKEKQLIFTRHIFPLDYTCQVNSDGFQLNEFKEAIYDLSNRIDKDNTFTVQCRIIDENEYLYNSHDISHFISDELISNGFKLQVENPCQIISVVLSDYHLYMGLSNAGENISSWAGGMRRYHKDEDQISRAEFKLEEAIEFFDIDLNSYKNALDLGAAPGGFTRVLAKKGLKVVAVDPAKMDSRLQNNPNVIHYLGLAQDYLKEKQHMFDVIVNDMRMDVMDSVKIMVMLSNRLKSGGEIVMTFKLPKKKPMATIQKGLEMLRKEFISVRGKQLFHNRSEITVTAKKK